MNSIATIVLAGLLVLSAYAQEPWAKDVNFYSLAQEIEFGKQTADQLERTLPIVHEAKVDAYLAKLTAALARSADKQFPYTFTLYDDRKPLAAAPNEMVFAFQLAHAMAHVELRHATRQATRAQIANFAAAPLQNASLGADADARQRALMQAVVRRFAFRFELQADTAATDAGDRRTDSKKTRSGKLPARDYSADTGEFEDVRAVAALMAQVPHQHHPPSSDEYAKVLEDPSRDEWQKPHDVVMALGLKSSDIIADIGAGTGYFARRFAHHAAKVYAVDIDEKLLAIARQDAPPNLETILAAPGDPRLPASKIDIIFFCDVLHHIENRPAYYTRLAKALKPDGRIVVVDFYKKDLPVGPPPAMKLSDDEVIAELRNAGFTLAKRLDILPYQYYLFFERGK